MEKAIKIIIKLIEQLKTLRYSKGGSNLKTGVVDMAEKYTAEIVPLNAEKIGTVPRRSRLMVRK